jgi:hypothetical protein
VSKTGINKTSVHKARRNVVDASNPVAEADEHLKALFSAVFTADTDERGAAIASTTNMIANHPDLAKLEKIGRRYETLAKWMCSLTNQLVKEIPTKTKIPEFTEDCIEWLMVKNSDAEADWVAEEERPKPHEINPDPGTIALASLTIVSYLLERTITDRAQLGDFVCGTTDISYQSMVA